MYTCNMKSKLFRGSLDTIVIKLLTENKELYGYQITQMVKDITKNEFNITEGALYPSLHRLEAKGTLTSTTKQVGSRLRKYYSLSKNGHVHANEALSDMESFIESLQSILNHKIATS